MFLDTEKQKEPDILLSRSRPYFNVDQWDGYIKILESRGYIHKPHQVLQKNRGDIKAPRFFEVFVLMRGKRFFLKLKNKFIQRRPTPTRQSRRSTCPIARFSRSENGFP